MTVGQLYGIIKELYNSSPEASEWFNLRTLMTELMIKYGRAPMEHILSPKNHADYAENLIFDAKCALDGYPLQYVTGKTAFWKSEFYVGEGVLIPRSDTEITVELALKKLGKDSIIYDLCCGSGCIGISMLAEREDIKKCFSFDISRTALDYTQKNAVLNGVNDRLEAVAYDIMSKSFPAGIPRPNMIVSNPPYIRSDEMAQLPKNVTFEPEIALAGGEDGCDFYRVILESFTPMLEDGGYILFEIAPGQEKILTPIFDFYGYETEAFRDYHKNIRTICGKKIKKY